MSLQKVFANKFIRLFSLKRNSQTFLIGCFLISFFIFDLSKAENNNLNFEKIDQTNLDFLSLKLVDIGISKVNNLNAEVEIFKSY